MMEIKIDNQFKFYIYVFFQIVITLTVLILICMTAYSIFFQFDSSYEKLIKMCDEQFGEGNWIMKDTKVRSNWFSIGQEVTCVSNDSGEYLNEIIGEKKQQTKGG